MTVDDTRSFDNISSLVNTANRIAREENRSESYCVLFADNDLQFASDFEEAEQTAIQGRKSREFMITGNDDHTIHIETAIINLS